MIKIVITSMLVKIIFVSNTVTTDYDALRSCVARTIEYIFEEDNLLLFLSNDKEIFPDAIKNPRVVVNSSQFRMFFKMKNIVAHYKKIEEFSKFKVPKRWTEKDTLLFVTSFRRIEDMKNGFVTLWKYFYNVVIINYDRKFKPIVIYSDQFAIRNKCGKICEEFIISGCNITSRRRFPKIFRKYPNCDLLYENVRTKMEYPFVKIAYITWFSLQIIARTLNLTFSCEEGIAAKKVSYLSVIRTIDRNAYVSTITTLPIYYDDVAWIVPAPKRIPSIAVLRLIFNPFLWLSIVVTYFLISVVWWLLVRVFNRDNVTNWFDVVFDVYRITLLGLTKRVPINWAVRYVFITYVIYSIHIQTAFTSNLVQILTIPQFGPHINNLQDLSNSDLPIFIREDVYPWVVKAEANTPLYQRLYKKFTIVPKTDFHNTLIGKNLDNCSIYLGRLNHIYYEKCFNKTFHYFIDNSFSGTTKHVFSGEFTVNLWPAFNRAVTTLLETGIFDLLVRNFSRIQTTHDYDLLNEKGKID
ncbi:hypothetical protein FQR65_LT01590 [Abscondita terminalis]|nr:hypothetical protein FQR65_LT01590 [Abscondita terminalis]